MRGVVRRRQEELDLLENWLLRKSQKRCARVGSVLPQRNVERPHREILSHRDRHLQWLPLQSSKHQPYLQHTYRQHQAPKSQASNKSRTKANSLVSLHQSQSSRLKQTVHAPRPRSYCTSGKAKPNQHSGRPHACGHCCRGGRSVSQLPFAHLLSDLLHLHATIEGSGGIGMGVVWHYYYSLLAGWLSAGSSGMGTWPFRRRVGAWRVDGA